MDPKKILIVDDDIMLILALQRRLRSAGYKSVYAVDAVAAIGTALKELPDLILLDVGMALRDGFWVLNQLKTLIETSTTPVIVLTGRDCDETRRHAFEAGATDFFQKPADEKKLLKAIELALAHGSPTVGMA